jgi:peptide/nickel transport system substrate-binding protein
MKPLDSRVEATGTTAPAQNLRAFDEILDLVKDGKLTRRQAVGRVAALGLGAAALGVGGAGLRRSTAAAQDATPKPGGILKVGLQADPTALDPQLQSLTAIWKIVEQVYGTLVRIAPDLSVQPSVAESWTVSDDGLTYTFKMRQGVNFHPPLSRPVVAGDVKYSFERLLDPATASTSAAELASVATIEAPDDATLVLTLKAPDAALLANLAGQACIIFAKETIDEHGDLSQVAVGSGPFIFKEYVPNTRIVLEKNPEYWEEGLPYLDGMEMIPVSEDTSRTTAVVTGTVDFIEYAPLRDIETFEGDDSIVLAGDANTNIRFIAFNLEREPFNNPLVRQAIAKVVDRDAMIAAAVDGYGTPTEVLFPQEFWAALQQPVSPPDVEGAKALMTEAGFPDGFETTITSWSAYSFLSNAAVVLQEQLKQINIEAELNLVENATMIADVHTNSVFDIAVTGTSGYIDPNGIIADFRSDSSSNFVNYNNPEVDTLIDQGLQATDQAARAEIYQQIQTLLLQDLPWINLFIANQYEAMKSYVKGYTHIATGSNIEFRNVWLDK